MNHDNADNYLIKSNLKLCSDEISRGVLKLLLRTSEQLWVESIGKRGAFCGNANLGISYPNQQEITGVFSKNSVQSQMTRKFKSNTRCCHMIALHEENILDKQFFLFSSCYLSLLNRYPHLPRLIYRYMGLRIYCTGPSLA